MEFECSYMYHNTVKCYDFCAASWSILSFVALHISVVPVVIVAISLGGYQYYLSETL